MLTVHIQGKYWILKDNGKTIYRSKDKDAVLERYQDKLKLEAISKETRERSLFFRRLT